MRTSPGAEVCEAGLFDLLFLVFWTDRGRHGGFPRCTLRRVVLSAEEEALNKSVDANQTVIGLLIGHVIRYLIL